MKKILLLSSVLSLNLFGACLEVGTTAGQNCSGSSIHLDSISNQSFTSIQVGSSNQVKYIPLYVASDSTEKVTMTLSNLANLIKGSDSMVTNYYFVSGNSESGTAVPIVNNTAFTLLNAGTTSRDGNTIVGYLKLIVPTVAALQTAGSYALSANISVKLTSSASASENLTANATVDYVTQVSFTDEVSGLTSGEGFKDSTVDYGNFILNQINSKTVNVYLKNNTTNDCTMSFAPVSLTHVDYPAYSIGMSYSYKNLNNVVHDITDASEFILKNGKNSGSKVGEMTFKTESLTGSLIAGEYKATINVTISAR